MILKVARMGHPVLRKVAEPVDPKELKTPEFKQLIKDMVETMFEYDGRGLAAPQIHVSKQILVMIWDFTPGEEPNLLVLVNPKLTPLTETTSEYWEGCLSVPGLRGKVARPNKIRVQAMTNTGETVDFVAEGFAATVVQHEVDHLLGVLYVDRVKDKAGLAFNVEYERYHASNENPESGGADLGED